MASTEVERFDGVDVAEVPSANWGWSKINYRNWHITGLLSIGLLLAFLRGNHVGHVEDLWVIGFAALGAFFLVARRRGAAGAAGSSRQLGVQLPAFGGQLAARWV